MPEQTLQLPREGERVGSGLVLSLISTGGSAYVYKTWNEALELHRAVKVMSPDPESDVRDRFQTEARINSKLIHPHIVQCFNFGLTEGGLPFLEMEYLSGPSLADLIESKGVLPTPVSLAAAIGILEGLSYAHTLKYTLYEKQHTGLIHRDLKPANVVVAADGHVKLMDFGIARPVDTSLHTVAGTVPGTVAYMSPEACGGGDCDYRSDIYQIGLCLYEFTTGQPAFPQADLTSLLEAKSSNKYPPPKTLTKAADPRVVAIINRCMQLDPAARYQSAHECLVAVRSLYDSLSSVPPRQLILDFLEGKSLPQPVHVFNTRRFFRFAAAIILAVGVTALLGFAGLRYGPALCSWAQPAPQPAPQTSLPVVASPEPIKPQELASAPNPRPASTPAAVRAPVSRKPIPVAQPAPRDTSPTPDDAMYDILAGKRLFDAADYSGALTLFQTAIKKPSTRPRQEVIRQAVYWSARSNTALYKKSAVPAANLVAAWRAVTTAFPAGSAEHTEAVKQLEEIQL